MEERFRAELMEKLADLGREVTERINMAVTSLFARYNVEEKCTELTVLDDTNERLLQRYIATLRLEGKSEETLTQYHRSIQNFGDCAQKNMEDISTNDIRYYLAMYQNRGVAKSTLDNERRYLSAYFAWLTAEEYIVKNPMLRIKKIKQDKIQKKAFSESDIEKLREKANIKERALIEFLLSTGCRVSEVVRLDVQDVDFTKGECVVFGKGSKERTVYLSERAMHYLNIYLCNRKESNVLFANRSGERWSKQSIEKCLKILGKHAEVTNVHPHRFRRTFATNALNRGMKLQNVQRILGHTSMDTTLIYCVLDEENVKMEHRQVA